MAWESTWRSRQWESTLPFEPRSTACAKAAAVTLVGNIASEVTLPLQKIVTRQIRLQGSCASAGEYPQAIDLMASGAIQVKPLITAVAPLEEGPQWFERLHSREPNLMKVILTPGASPERSRDDPPRTQRTVRFEWSSGNCDRSQPGPGTISRTRSGACWRGHGD